MFIGACKNYSRMGMIGALPVGLRGKIYGQPFKVLVQYDAFGGVRTQIFEDETGGGMCTELRGERSEKEDKGKALGNWAYQRYKRENQDKFPFNDGTDYAIKERQKIERDLQKRSEALIKNLVDETIAFNKGKTGTKKATKSVNIAPKKTARKKPAAKPKFRTIFVREYKVPGYTVPKHKRRIPIR